MDSDMEHVTVGGGPNLTCHWPRQGGFWRWGDELLVGYIEAPCDYTDEAAVGHGQGGIWKHGYVRLRRSTDAGVTWEDDHKLFDNSMSVEQQRQALMLDQYTEHGGPLREEIAISSSDAMLMMGRAWCGDEYETESGTKNRGNVVYCFRSPDRGRTWEDVPSIVWPNHTQAVVELANNTLKLGGSRVVCWVVGCDGIEGVTRGRLYAPQLFLSENDGETWNFYSEICSDPAGRIAYSYPQIVVLPSGRWLCFLGAWYITGGARTRWTSVCHSDDEGLNWSAPRRIHAWSVSPFPLLLKDGRIVVVYMRRNPDPTGLYAIVSNDDGQTWSEPVCLRDDTVVAGPRGVIDGGYPLAVEMDDGRIFAVYYWQHDDADVPWHGGRKFIGGTYFRT